ncbi:MAG: hypothetical protein V5A34_10650 [Halapricum sp.]
MTKMNSIPSSKGTAVLVALVIAMAAVGTAAAVSVSETSTSQDEVEVGEEVTAEVTLTDLYENDSEWTLRGTSGLENVTGWEVTKAWSNESERSETFEGESEFEINVTENANFESITVSITGDAPAVDEYSYNPPQEFEAAKLTKTVGEGESDVATVSVHHYTNESQAARQAIEDAEEAVEDADSAEAENRLQQAISAFNSENFANAEDIANDAKNTAEEAKQSQNTTQLLLYGIGAVVVLLLIGGGYYYYRSQQDSYDKLR